MVRATKRNITLHADFAAYITKLRVARGLTKSELAAQSHLTDRTIRDLEAGRKPAIQEKTLMLLGNALEVDAAHLLHQASGLKGAQSAQTQAGRVKRALPAALLGLALLATIAGWLIWRSASRNATWELDQNGGSLQVRDSVLNSVLWQIDGGVYRCTASPWSSEELIVGFSSRTPDGNHILCLERATGDTLWSVGPDIDAIRSAFGSDIVDAAGFSCAMLARCDLQGDGQPELVVYFSHGLYYPAAICIVDQTGKLESQYVNKGHLYDLLIEDINSDGRDEIIAAGVNNDRAYMGATIFILDDQHRHGASVDDLANPESREVDGAKFRTVIPRFPSPYMELLDIVRVTAWNLRTAQTRNGGCKIVSSIGHYEKSTYTAIFDTCLNLQEIVLDDRFKQEHLHDIPDSLKLDTGFADRAWQRNWVSQRRLWRAGEESDLFTIQGANP